MRTADRRELLDGFRDSFPVFLGYLAVSFTVGISAKNAGLTAFQASLMSFLNTTSAGQAAAIGIISAGGSYLEIILSQLAINLRYLLMGAVLSVRLDEGEGLGRRLLAGFGLTDEIFALSSTRKPLNPWYPFGGWLMAMPGWVLGTCLGVVVNSVVSEQISQALSMSLYAMFVAIVVPPAKREGKIAVLVVFSMVVSALVSRIFPSFSTGMKVVVLTLAISALAALVWPVEQEK